MLPPLGAERCHEAKNKNMANTSAEHFKAVEQLGKNENRERAPSFHESEAAFLNVFGNWKAFVGKDEFSVRPLTSKDISWLSGSIARAVQEKEGAVKSKLEGTSLDNADEAVAKKGEPARQAILETQAAVQGEVEFLNKLYTAIFDGLQTKTPDIFVVAPEKAASYLMFRHQSETSGPEVDPTLTDTDISSEGVDCAYVLNPSKGEEIEKIFKDNGHTVTPLKTAKGFQARLGGVRLVFFYSVMSEPENKEAWLDATGKKKERDKTDLS